MAQYDPVTGYDIKDALQFNPTPKSVYVENCIVETGHAVYGRDNRTPIHDAIDYAIGQMIIIGRWCNDIGLCVKDGKLSVIYNG